MRKNELLNTIDDELLEKLYGFCYAKTRDSYEAQDLCSDIIFALVKSGKFIRLYGRLRGMCMLIFWIGKDVILKYSMKGIPMHSFH